MDYHPFEGRLVRLRARELDDVPRFHRWLNDPEMTQYIEIRYPQSLAGERRYIESLPDPGFEAARFAIETLAGHHIGSCVLRGATPENRCAELGISIGEREYWSNGYGTDAMEVVCRFGFDFMNLHRIELTVFEDNPRAIRCYEKLGFEHEGRLRQADYRFGRYRDKLLMGLLASEWNTRNSSPGTRN